MKQYIESIRYYNKIITQLGYSRGGTGKQIPDDCLNIIQQFVSSEVRNETEIYLVSHYKKQQKIIESFSRCLFSRNEKINKTPGMKRIFSNYAENGSSWMITYGVYYGICAHHHAICGTNCAKCGNYYVFCDLHQNQNRYPNRIHCQCMLLDFLKDKVHNVYLLGNKECKLCSKRIYLHDWAYPLF